VTLTLTWHWGEVAGRRLLWVRASRTVSEAGVPAAAQDAFSAALAEIGGAGLPDAAIVRSRVRVSQAQDRAEASRVRHEVLDGPRRAASASFVDHGDPLRRVTVELAALGGHGEPRKSIVERQPPAPTCQWVEVGGLVFLSGLTYDAPVLDAQVDGILAALTGVRRPGDTVLHATVFHDRAVAARVVRRLLSGRAPWLRCPVEWAAVDGFSAPGKRMEVEFTLGSDPVD
jgi:hypothetical protein